MSLLAASMTGAASAGASASAPLSAAAPASSESSLNKDRMERWLDDGDRELIAQSFRRHPDEVLPFFDEYLETGMKMLEQRAPYEDFMKQYRRGIKFAQIASEVWRDPIFGEYAAHFASWSEPERKQFREGQQTYRTGSVALKSGNAAEAKERLQTALDLSEPLGDVWGTQMALSGLARASVALEDWEAANVAAQRAVDLSVRLQLRTAEIENCLICVDARQRLNAHDAGLGHARQAWGRLQRSDSQAMRSRAGEALATALERLGKNDEAAKIRAESGVPVSTAPAPPASPASPPSTPSAPAVSPPTATRPPAKPPVANPPE